MSKHLLLDSHAFLWAAAEPEKLGVASRAAIEDPSNLVSISAASIWELLLKAAKGKLDLGPTPDKRLRKFVNNLQSNVLPVRFNHIVEAYSLPGVHRKPFDRLLIGQARSEDLTLVTRDRTIEAYDVQVLW